MCPAWLVLAGGVQCLQGQPPGCAVFRQLGLDTRWRVLSLKRRAHGHGMLQDCTAAGGKELPQPAANGKGFALTLA